MAALKQLGPQSATGATKESSTATTATIATKTTTASSTTATAMTPPSKKSLLHRVWPLDSAVLLVIFPLMHKYLLINAGYTKWFHAVGWCYLLTQNKWLSRFLAVMGTTVTLGWWASMMFDYYQHGRYAHVLLWNMPEVMMQHYLTDDGQVLYDTAPARAMIALSHGLDTLAHPVLALYFWRQHQFDPAQVLHWSVIITSYALSRYWSAFHHYYNDGVLFRPFYIGRDVYNIHDDNDDNLLGLWLPAYLAEGACYVLFVTYKLVWEPAIRNSTNNKGKQQQHIILARADTTLSISSISEDFSALDDEVYEDDDDYKLFIETDKNENIYEYPTSSAVRCINSLAFLDAAAG